MPSQPTRERRENGPVPLDGLIRYAPVPAAGRTWLVRPAATMIGAGYRSRIDDAIDVAPCGGTGGLAEADADDHVRASGLTDGSP